MKVTLVYSNNFIRKVKEDSMRKTICFIAMALLLGCVTGTQNVKTDYSFNVTKDNNGLVIFSLTSEGRVSPPFELVAIQNASDAPVIYFRGLTNNLKGSKNAISGTQNMFDGSRLMGGLIVLELPAGQYEFFNFSHGNKVLKRPFSFKFSVIQNKAIYLGNIVNWIEHKQEGANITLLPSSLRVRDMRERDITIFKNHWKSISENAIEYQIIK